MGFDFFYFVNIIFIYFYLVYNAFIANGGRDNPRSDEAMRWCSEYSIKHKVMVRATQIRSRLVSLCTKFGIPLGKSEKRDEEGEEESLADKIVKCIVAGFFANAAVMLPDTSYRLIRGSSVVNK